MFGRYTLVGRIARGGQSAIYEARSTVGVRAALKILMGPRQRTPESTERVRREAVAIKRLDHPNVVRLFDSGETADGSPWLAMELLEGESLGALLERVGHLPEAEILSILAPICEALQQAHKKGIVHRDLKPQNIMLVPTDAGRVPKLLDFGMAALRDEDTLTSSVTVSGTPMYMAPEQWGGLKFADARSDVYSLGVIVYQALSGRFPFDADGPLVWMKKVHSEPPLDLSVATGGRAVSPALCAAVMKALAKDPQERPQTPMELYRALQPAPPSMRRDVTPRPWRWVLVAALVAGVGGAAVGLYASRGGGDAPAARPGPPIVVLMDTPVPHGVYDGDVVAQGGTNADTINDLLRDLPINIQKETIPSTWNREMNVMELKPNVIVVHRSAFFHGLNVEFGFGYEPFPDARTKERWTLLYRTAEDKLIAFMGLAATLSPRTRFLVYSRGTGMGINSSSGWPDADYRRQWVSDLEQRFPQLKGRVTTMAIEGGVEKGSFKSPVVVQQTRRAVRAILDSGTP